MRHHCEHGNQQTELHLCFLTQDARIHAQRLWCHNSTASNKLIMVIMLHVGKVTEYRIKVADLVAAPVILLKIRQSDGMRDTQKLLQHLKDLLPVPG